MRKKYIYLLVLSIFILFLLLCILSYKSPFKKNEKYGNKLIDMIYSYKENTGELPNSFVDLQLPVDDYWGGMATRVNGIKFYYEKLSKTDFEIWYDISVGESMYYNSIEKKWSINPYF